MSSTVQSKPLRLMVLVLVLLIVVKYLPYGDYILYPVKLFLTWLHEFGHAVASLLVGGNVDSLRLYPDTTGLTKTLFKTSRFRHVFVSSAGYAGTTSVGMYLLLSQRSDWWRRGLGTMALFGVGACLAWQISSWEGMALGATMLLSLGALAYWPSAQKSCAIGIGGVGGFALLSLMLMHDPFSMIVACVFGVFFVLVAIFGNQRWTRITYTMFALICVSNPLFFLDRLYEARKIVNGRSLLSSDAHLVAQVANVMPSFFWAFCWMAIPIGFIIWLMITFQLDERKQSKLTPKKSSILDI